MSASVDMEKANKRNLAVTILRLFCLNKMFTNVVQLMFVLATCCDHDNGPPFG